MSTPSPNVAPPPRLAAPEDRPFWDALDAGRFVLARCRCGAHTLRSQACLHCGAPHAAARWVPATAHGTVRTFVVFDKAYHPYFATRLPYVVAVVALEEGPELLTNLVDVDPADITIGMPVRIVIVERDGQRLHQASARRAG